MGFSPIWLRRLARAPTRLVATLLVVRLADEWVAFLPSGALESLRDDLGLSYAEAGTLLVLLPAGGLAGTVFTVAADYVSRRALAASGAFAGSACLAVFALPELGGTFLALAVASFALGAASDAYVHGAEVALVDIAGERLEPTLARVNLLGAFGDLLGPLTLAATAALGLGWRPAFGLCAVMLAGYGLVLALSPLPPPAPRDGRARPAAAVVEVARDRRVLRLAAADLLLGLLDEPFLGFAIAYLVQRRGHSATLATLMAGVVVAGGLLGYARAARAEAAPRPSRERLRSGAALLAGGSAGLVLAPVVALQAVAAFVIGVAGARCWVSLQALILRLRPGQAGTTSAVVSTISLTGVGYPLLVGWASDRAGLGVGLWLYVAVAVALALTTRNIRP